MKSIAKRRLDLAIIAAFLTTPAHAWTFTPGQPCVLTHEAREVSVELTYDPTKPLYTISLTREAPFDPAPTFSMQFQGGLPISIGTDRHQMSNGNRTVSVADVGFGNVLNGLQFNFTAIATLGSQSVEIPLIGAEEPVAAFRACEAALPAA